MSQLFVAQIVLPKLGNNGESLESAHAYIRKSLCKHFGGFTALDSFGGWIDPDSGVEYLEAGITYQTGMADTAENAELLRVIAIEAGIMAQQLAMAVTLPNRAFEILTIAQEESRNAEA
ncbi:hypothetical protein RWE87_13440 [Sinorhizobium meliloti]|uniref:hypothetical protein n=1 Tax=Rhizobium meliloti TaxID=382 RepID=UPI00299DA047|nr:hypothetical protein [Sinorhizobium meliloti]MDX0267644.1 hypothetical protein [Sinorhizobium meliloti]